MALFEIKLYTAMSDAQFGALKQEIQKMSLNIDALISEVQENSSVTQSAVTTLGALRDEIAALRDQTNDPATEAKLAELVSTLDNNNAALAAAISAGTPAAEPTPEPAPETPTE